VRSENESFQCSYSPFIISHLSLFPSLPLSFHPSTPPYLDALEHGSPFKHVGKDDIIDLVREGGKEGGRVKAESDM